MTSERAADALEEQPDLPVELLPVFNMWLKLHKRRGSSGFGPNPISYTEIESYSRLLRTPLSTLEVELITLGDDAYRHETFLMSETQQGKETNGA